jgi:RNA polymerase sigma-70 factor (ECF subfamily)
VRSIDSQRERYGDEGTGFLVADSPVREVSKDHDRFLRLFTINESAVRAYVRRLVQLRSDVDDLMQNVAVVLWSKFDQFQDGRDFRAWAFGIARFEVLAWVRDHSRDRRVLASDVLELIADESQERERELSRQRSALECCLGKLRGDQKELLLYVHQPGSSMLEAAAQSGRTNAGFAQWLYRMRQSLLDCVRREVSREACS